MQNINSTLLKNKLISYKCKSQKSLNSKTNKNWFPGLRYPMLHFLINDKNNKIKSEVHKAGTIVCPICLAAISIFSKHLLPTKYIAFFFIFIYKKYRTFSALKYGPFMLLKNIQGLFLYLLIWLLMC